MKKQILILALILSPIITNAQGTFTFNPDQDHYISLTNASAITQRYRDSSAAGVNLAATFGKTAIQAILNQTGTQGIRFYFARENGVQTLISVGVNSSGGDMTSGLLAEKSVCCKPTGCPYKCASSELNGNPSSNISSGGSIDPDFDHSITLSNAAILTKAFRDSVPGYYNLACAFGKTAIQNILNQEGCVGVRLYFAIDDSGLMTLVAVGVTSNGNDITSGYLAERALCCKPSGCFPCATSALNTN